MFLEHNSNIVLEFVDNIMLCEHNVPEAYFIFGANCRTNDQDFALLYSGCRAQKDFQEVLKHPGTDHDLINRHATRFRLITATLANRMNELVTLLGEGHEKDDRC